MFTCLSLHWHSAVSSGQKPFPGKHPAPYAACGSANVIKHDIKKHKCLFHKSIQCQMHSYTHILANNGAENTRGSHTEERICSMQYMSKRAEIQVYTGIQRGTRQFYMAARNTVTSTTRQQWKCPHVPTSPTNAQRKWKSRENTRERAEAYLRLRLLLILLKQHQRQRNIITYNCDRLSWKRTVIYDLCGDELYTAWRTLYGVTYLKK